MDNKYYAAIFRRKSFHLFRGVGNGTLTEEDLKGVEEAYHSFESLYPEIKTAIRIVPSSLLGGMRGSEYCILLYSEEKLGYLMNLGYLGEQLDLYLVGNHIGTLWLGAGKTEEPVYEGLSYVIMLLVHKVSDEKQFRKDMFKATRKPLSSIWEGDTLGVGEIARFAPSACNSQPWRIRNENGVLSVLRYRKPSRVGLLSPKNAFFFNRLDMGIFLCVLEVCLAEKKVGYTRELFIDEEDKEYALVATYTLKDSP